MASIHEFQQRSSRIKATKVKDRFFKYIREVERLFFQLNAEQLEDSQDATGKLLQHKDKNKFPGTYSPLTEDFAKEQNPLAPKIAGQPYNFLWTGDFLKGFTMFIKTGSIEINSTGTGTDKKAEFFDGYKNLFGLTDKNLKKVIDKELMPFILKHYREELGI